ncbi:MAG: hypothetical protein OXI24_11455 [Candidatus Poribacteria bacterium]|nr:hypothetical protein [Candidatus Poribacteria bacterium]
MIDRRDFVQNLGFSDDPFAHTNADEEVSRLPEYFVKPPYFAEVFGDPDDPKSFFVFAPRGGGKSAQRIMIESRCRENNVLALTYDNFDFFGLQDSTITLEHHVRRILQIGFVGLLVSINHDSAKSDDLSKPERSLLAQKVVDYVGDMSLSELKSTLDSLKSLSDKFSDFIEKYRAIVGTGANALSNHFLGSDAHIPPVNLRHPTAFNAKYELELLIQYAMKLGYRSVYVLIDRVDESEYSGGKNNPLDAFELIRPMVKSLTLLEMPGIGFKFFLWDAIEPHYKEVARTDRINSRKLEWTTQEFSELLRKRLLAFSNQRIWRLAQISDKLEPFEIDDLAIIFASTSPRDLIRVCKKIFAEQEQIDYAGSTLTERAIYLGIDVVCEELLEDLVNEGFLAHLRQVGTHSNQVDFTVSHVSVSSKISTNSARSRIQKWKDAGIIVELREVANPRTSKGPKVKLYGVVDVRLARLMASRLSTKDFLESKVKPCSNSNCRSYLIRDWNESDSTTVCHLCGFDKDREFPSSNGRVQGDKSNSNFEPKQLHLFNEKSK